MGRARRSVFGRYSSGQPLNFTPATDDVQVEVAGRAQLLAAIQAVEPGHATIIILHRRSEKQTSYVFNWRQCLYSEYERERYLRFYARRVSSLPKEFFL